MPDYFDPLYSTNTIYIGDDDTRCLTDEIDTLEADIIALETGKADTNHTHTGYATADHVHSNYVTSTHTHSYNDLSDKPTIPTTLPANGGNADTVDNKHASDFADAAHTHAVTDVTGLSDQLSAKYTKPSTGIPKTDLTSDIQTSLGKADTAVQSLDGYATESYVNTQVAGIVDTAPEALNTLNELAAALGDNPNFATTITTQLGEKVDKINGKGLSTNDFTNAEKSKLDGISEGANAYTLPVAGSSLGGVKTTSTITNNEGYTACPIIEGVPYYKDTNSTYTLSSFGINATATELNYTDGVTSNIQTQLNNKAASSHNHSASNITSGTLSNDRLATIPISKGGTGATTVAGALTNLGNIGKSYISNPSNVSVARVTWQTIASTTLPAGTYVIVGNHQWGLSSAGTMSVDRIWDGNNTYCTNRYFMNGGGGTTTVAVVVLTTSTTIKYETYHEHSAAATATGIHLYAVKIK